MRYLLMILVILTTTTTYAQVNYNYYNSPTTPELLYIHNNVYNDTTMTDTNIVGTKWKSDSITLTVMMTNTLSGADKTRLDVIASDTTGVLLETGGDTDNQYAIEDIHDSTVNLQSQIDDVTDTVNSFGASDTDNQASLNEVYDTLSNLQSQIDDVTDTANTGGSTNEDTELELFYTNTTTSFTLSSSLQEINFCSTVWNSSETSSYFLSSYIVSQITSANSNMEYIVSIKDSTGSYVFFGDTTHIGLKSSGDKEGVSPFNKVSDLPPDTYISTTHGLVISGTADVTQCRVSSMKLSVGKGEQGVTGATGSQGEIGETGAVGSQGVQGIQGVKGETGITTVVGGVDTATLADTINTHTHASSGGSIHSSGDTWTKVVVTGGPVNSGATTTTTSSTLTDRAMFILDIADSSMWIPTGIESASVKFDVGIRITNSAGTAYLELFNENIDTVFYRIETQNTATQNIESFLLPPDSFTVNPAVFQWRMKRIGSSGTVNFHWYRVMIQGVVK